MLTLTPHIVRVLDLSESDLRPFRLGRDVPGGGGRREPASLVPRDIVPRDREVEPARIGADATVGPVTAPDGAGVPAAAAAAGSVSATAAGPLPGVTMPVPPPPPPPKKPGGGH